MPSYFACISIQDMPTLRYLLIWWVTYCLPSLGMTSSSLWSAIWCICISMPSWLCFLILYSYWAHHFWEFCEVCFLIVLAWPSSRFASPVFLPKFCLGPGICCILLGQSQPSGVVGFKKNIVYCHYACISGLYSWQWRSHWGGKGGRVPPLTAKKLPKIGEKRVKNKEKREKIRKIGKKKAKIGKFLSLYPSWQIGLATLLIAENEHDEEGGWWLSL